MSLATDNLKNSVATLNIFLVMKLSNQKRFNALNPIKAENKIFAKIFTSKLSPMFARFEIRIVSDPIIEKSRMIRLS